MVTLMLMRNQTLKILYIYNGIFVFAMSLLGPLYAIFVSKIDNDVLAISWSTAATIVSSTVFTFLISKIPDRNQDERLMLMVGYMARSLGWLLFVFVDNLWQIILIQILLGFGEGIATPAFQSMFAEHLDKNHHISDYSYWQLIANGCMIAAVIIGGLIVKYYGFNSLFISMSILAFISYLGVSFKRTSKK